MNVSQSALLSLCLYALLLGAALGLLYDALRITRVLLGAHYGRQMERLYARELPLIGKRRNKAGKRQLLAVAVFVEDLLFCLIAGICMILLFYQINSGRFRIAGLLSAVGGFFFYRATAGRPIMACSEMIAFGAETAVRYALFFICFPLRWMACRLKRRCKRLIGRILARIDRIARKRQTERQAHVRADFVGNPQKQSLKRKEGRHAKGKKKGLQSEPAGKDISGDHGRRFHRGIHK